MTDASRVGVQPAGEVGLLFPGWMGRLAVGGELLADLPQPLRNSFVVSNLRRPRCRAFAVEEIPAHAFDLSRGGKEQRWLGPVRGLAPHEREDAEWKRHLQIC